MILSLGLPAAPQIASQPANNFDYCRAEILKGISSAFIASLRFYRASALVAALPRWVVSGLAGNIQVRMGTRFATKGRIWQ
jgi:hypothetical protein